MSSPALPLEVAAPIIAALGLLVYLRLGKRHYGPDADYWEILRRSLLPQLNRLAKRNGWGYAAYTLSEDEHLGRTDEDVEAFEHRLHDLGFKRMPIAAYKYTEDGRGEIGSWAYRDSLLTTHQTHLILFHRDDDKPGVDVYGHSEYNAYNPMTAHRHYIGTGLQPLGGLGLDYVLDTIESQQNP